MGIFDGDDRRDQTIARFYTNAVEDTEATRLHGRPVFKNVPFVKVRVPDDPFTLIDHPASEADKRRWAREWDAYQHAEQKTAEGVPIAAFPVLSPADLATLRAYGVQTVEQLADLAEELVEKLGAGFMELRERARQFLQPASDTEQELRAKVAELEKQVVNLKAQMNQAKPA